MQALLGGKAAVGGVDDDLEAREYGMVWEMDSVFGNRLPLLNDIPSDRQPSQSQTQHSTLAQ